MRTAAAESPPPTTENDGRGGDRLGDRRVPSANGAELEHAHRAVPEHGAPTSATISANVAARLRADVQAQPAVRDGVGADDLRSCASAANASAMTTSVGSTILSPFSASSVLADLDLVVLQQRVADAVALARPGR